MRFFDVLLTVLAIKRRIREKINFVFELKRLRLRVFYLLDLWRAIF